MNASTGAFVSQWSQPAGTRTNDVAFLPGGEILVTGSNLMFRYDAAHNLIGTYAGTGWLRAHGIDISPWDGNIYVADGARAAKAIAEAVILAAGQSLLGEGSAQAIAAPTPRRSAARR